MDNLDKEFTLIVTEVAKLKLPECRDCGGSGKIWTCEDTEHETSYTVREKGTGWKCWLGHKLIEIPCLTCATLRKLAEIEWHEVHVYHSGRHCNCGIRIPAFQSGPHPCDNKNLTYTIETAVQMMKDLGKWERFEGALRNDLYYLGYKSKADVWWQGAFNILTTPELFIAAATSYLKSILND